MFDNMPEFFWEDEEKTWYQREQLYMVEVIVDKVLIREDNAMKRPDPILPMIVKIQFADFPVMEVEKNQLLLTENMDKQGNSSINNKIIRGIPDDWTVSQAGDEHYVVEIPDRFGNMGGPVKIAVPKLAVGSGDGLKYIRTAVRSRGGEELSALVERQLNEEMVRIRETGDSGHQTQHTFSAGKSCLFHMTPYDLMKSFEDTPLKVEVYRSGSVGGEFVHTLIGEADIPLGLSFAKAVLLANTPVLLPVAAHVEDVFTITDNFERDCGSISMFVRLSCFGASVFKEQVNVEAKKQKFLKNLYKKEKEREREPYLTGGDVDLKYPWKKNLNFVGERPAPKPRLVPLYDPVPPPPPLAPMDFGENLHDLPRCSPLTPPPCYRKAWDAPFSRCTREIENQLRREELTKGAQTETFTAIQTQQVYLPPESGGLKGGDEAVGCTCPHVPPELTARPGDTSKVQCTCSAIVQSLASTQPQSCGPTNPVPPPNTIDISSYELTLTKPECGLEVQKEDYNAPQESTQNVNEPTKSEMLEQKQFREEIDKNTLEQAKDNSNEEDSKFKKSASRILKSEEAGEKEEIKTTTSIPLDNDEEGGKPFDEFDDFFVRTDSPEKAEKKRKPVDIYEYTAGMYPGHHFGHKHCITPGRRVPKSMGWLWTAVTFGGLLKAGRWRPGSIRKDVTNMLHKLREEDALSEHEKPETQGFVRRPLRPATTKSQLSKRTTEAVKHSPTLHVHKKEGYIYVSMIPVRTDSQEEAGEEVKPIQFKIDPKHPDGLQGDESCDVSTDSSSDVKSYALDFVAPIALKRVKKKVEKNATCTQYNEHDFAKKAPKKSKPEESIMPPEKEKKHKKCKGKHKK